MSTDFHKEIEKQLAGAAAEKATTAPLRIGASLGLGKVQKFAIPKKNATFLSAKMETPRVEESGRCCGDGAHFMHSSFKQPDVCTVSAAPLSAAELAGSEEEKHRLNAAHLLLTSMQTGIEQEQVSAADEPLEETAPPHKRFKKFLGVEPGIALREIEKEIEAREPNLSIQGVRRKARAELSQRERHEGRLQWKTNAPDSAIVQQLRVENSAEADKLVEAFEETYTRLSSKTPDDAAQQTSFNDLRRLQKKRSAATAESVVKQANALLGVETPTTNTSEKNEGEGVAPLSLTVTNSELLSLPPTKATRTEETTAGLAVHYNSFSEGIDPGVHTMSDFAMLYAASKSRTEEKFGSDAMQCLARFHVEAINGFLKILESAPADACLTAKGERPSGSMAVDLRRILEDNNFDASCLSNERLLKYQALWQQTHTSTPSDIERSLAMRAVKIDREKAASVMRNIGMSETEIQSAMTHGKSAEMSTFMRAVLRSVETEAFLRAEEQSEQDNYLEKRVKAALKKDAKQQSATGGGRGREALGFSTAAPGTTAAPAAGTKSLGVSLEVVTRAYLQSFMRPAVLENERQCVRGEQCFCLTMAASFPAMSSPEGKSCGFIGREFLLPSQLASLNAHGKLPEYRGMCVICDRAAVTAAVYEHVQNRREPKVPLHGYIVEIDVPGGYRRDLLLEPIGCGTRLTGIVGPFPALNPQNLVFSKVYIDERLHNCLLETETDFQTGSASTPRI